MTETEINNQFSQKSMMDNKVKNRNFRPFAVLLLFILSVTIILVVLNITNSSADTPTAPDFELLTFDGDYLSLSDLRGDIVVLHFWASWCPPCRVEAPEFQATWELYENRGDVHFIGLAYRDQVINSQAFIDEFGISYMNAPDLGHEIATIFSVQGIPSTFIINREGQVVSYLYAGISMDTLIKEIETLLDN